MKTEKNKICSFVIRISLVSLLLSVGWLYGQNTSLHFDGKNDFVTLSPVSGFLPDDDFTVELWFKLNDPLCNEPSTFMRMFILADSQDKTLYEVGFCNSELVIHYFSTYSGSNSGFIQVNVPHSIHDNNWHHLAVTRSGDKTQIYLDCDSIWDNMGVGILATDIFQLGQGTHGYIPMWDFYGELDEVRLWRRVLTDVQIQDNCLSCLPSNSDPDLIAYWRFQDGVGSANNTQITVVSDATSNLNNGVLSSSALVPSGFSLDGHKSNFLDADVPLPTVSFQNYQVILSDPTGNNPVSEICDGTPVHFRMVDMQGQPVVSDSNVDYMWEYSDNGGSIWYDIIPGYIEFNPSSFAFLVQPSNPNIRIDDCQNHPTGFVERIFRMRMEFNSGANPCTYYAFAPPLRICCPISGSTIQMTPQGPHCEGDEVQFEVTVSSNLPPPGSNNHVGISWSVTINGAIIPLTGPGYDNSVMIYYPASGSMTLVAGQITFSAEISNCGCSPEYLQVSVQVDPKPICGTIIASDIPANLLPHMPPDSYYICPGEDAALEVDISFQNCNIVWEYMYPTQPGIWHGLGGLGNTGQNTNILPPGMPPLLWPQNEECIVYRVKCQPLGYPNSGCDPCYSNQVMICLKMPPEVPVIEAVPNIVCDGDVSVLTVLNPQSGLVYTWRRNGLVFDTGVSVPTSLPGSYWVEASNECHTVKSEKVLVEVCVVTAIISCPEPPCPLPGTSITLSGALSSSTCAGSLTYYWSWAGPVSAGNSTGITLVHTPETTGTTYTLTVTDANGCTDTTQVTIIPCDN